MKRCLLLVLLLMQATLLVAQPTDAYLLGRLNAGHMPGAGFVIVKDGHWAWQKNLGKADIAASKDADLQTIYMMASVSKTMIVTAVMQLWERGLINLDADINNYLPFSVRTPSHPNDSITARMLLTHTSALEDNWPVMGSLYVYGDSPISLDTFMKHYFVPGGSYYSAAGNFYTYKPGNAANYSNMGSTLAAYLVERISGDAFSHYCDTAIFRKICMDNTSFLLAGISDTTRIARPYYWDGSNYIDVGLYGYPDYPDGQLRTNITAMARFMAMYLNHGSYEGTRVLDSATVAEIMKPQTPAAWYQGLIFYMAGSSGGDTLWGHNGGDAGVNTAMYFSFKTKTGVIVLTNGEGTSAANADLLADTLYNYGVTLTPGANDTFPSCNMVTTVQDAPYDPSDVSLYPNPAKATVTLVTPAAGQAAIADLQGRPVAVYPLQPGSNMLGLSTALPAGMYLVRVTDARGRLIDVRKLVLIR